MDDYTDQPTFLRVYREETGDECVWHIDGANYDGEYTEAVERYASLAEALAAAPSFMERNGIS